MFLVSKPGGSLKPINRVTYQCFHVMSVLPNEIVSDIQVRIHRAGVSALVSIEILNVEYNDEEQITGLHMGPAIAKETVEILDGYTYFRKGEEIALTREEVGKIAKVVIQANQSLEPVEVVE
jgi:hypothetical protein